MVTNNSETDNVTDHAEINLQIEYDMKTVYVLLKYKFTSLFAAFANLRTLPLSGESSVQITPLDVGELNTAVGELALNIAGLS